MNKSGVKWKAGASFLKIYMQKGISVFYPRLSLSLSSTVQMKKKKKKKKQSNEIFTRHKNAIQISHNKKIRAQTGKKRESFVTVMIFHHKAETRKTKGLKICDDQLSAHR